MPIYSYRCETCGFQQDVLRKMSDPLLVDCPSCSASTFVKQVTAAGFQLKGSGWYVTDFRNPASKEATKGGEAGNDKAGDKANDKGGETDGAKGGSKDGAPASGAAPAAPESGAAPAKSAPSTESKSSSTSAKPASAPTTGSS